jgi:hypothetical protein
LLEGEWLAILLFALLDDVMSILLTSGLSSGPEVFLNSKAVCEFILKFWFRTMLVRGVG